MDKEGWDKRRTQIQGGGGGPRGGGAAGLLGGGGATGPCRPKRKGPRAWWAGCGAGGGGGGLPWVEVHGPLSGVGVHRPLSSRTERPRLELSWHLSFSTCARRCVHCQPRGAAAAEGEDVLATVAVHARIEMEAQDPPRSSTQPPLQAAGPARPPRRSQPCRGTVLTLGTPQSPRAVSTFNRALPESVPMTRTSAWRRVSGLWPCTTTRSSSCTCWKGQLRADAVEGGTRRVTLRDAPCG